MKTWYFTFGSDTSLAQNYIKIEAMSAGDARAEMFKHQGVLWGFQYDEEAFLPQIKEYTLTEVPLGTKCVRLR